MTDHPGSDDSGMSPYPSQPPYPPQPPYPAPPAYGASPAGSYSGVPGYPGVPGLDPDAPRGRSGCAIAAFIDAFDINGVPCSDTHNAQAFFVVPFSESSYPGTKAIEQQSQQACSAKFGPYRQPSLQLYTLYPTQSRWAGTDGRRAVCFVIRPDEGDLIGSLVN